MRGIFLVQFKIIMIPNNPPNTRRRSRNTRNRLQPIQISDSLSGTPSVYEFQNAQNAQSNPDLNNSESNPDSSDNSELGSDNLDSQELSSDNQELSSDNQSIITPLPRVQLQHFFEKAPIQNQFEDISIVDLDLELPAKKQVYFSVGGKCHICKKQLAGKRCCFMKQAEDLSEYWETSSIPIKWTGKPRAIFTGNVWSGRKSTNTLKQSIESAGFQFTSKNIYVGQYFANIELTFPYVGDNNADELLTQLDDCFDYLPLQIVHIDDKKGRGVRATSNIPKDTILCKYSGQFFCQVDRQTIKRTEKANSIVFLGYADDIQLSIEPIKYSDLGRFFNHSTDPNIALSKSYTRNGLVLVMKTIKKILKGEQLCWDYGPGYWNAWNSQIIDVDDDDIPPVATKKKMSQKNFLSYFDRCNFMFQPAILAPRNERIDCASLVKLAVSLFIEYLQPKIFLKFGSVLQMPLIPLKFRKCEFGNTNIGINENCFIEISELMKGMLIGSGCDCALTLARYFGSYLTHRFGPVDQTPFGHVCVFLHFLNCFLKENQIDMHVNDPRGVGLNNTASLKGIISLLKLIVAQKGITYDILLTKPKTMECDSQRINSCIKHEMHTIFPTFSSSHFYGKTGTCSTTVSFGGFCFDKENKYVFLAFSAPFNNREQVLQKSAEQIINSNNGMIPVQKIKEIQFTQQTPENVAQMKNNYSQIRMLIEKDELSRIREFRCDKTRKSL